MKFKTNRPPGVPLLATVARSGSFRTRITPSSSRQQADLPRKLMKSTSASDSIL